MKIILYNTSPKVIWRILCIVTAVSAMITGTLLSIVISFFIYLGEDIHEEKTKKEPSAYGSGYTQREAVAESTKTTVQDSVKKRYDRGARNNPAQAVISQKNKKEVGQ